MSAITKKVFSLLEKIGVRGVVVSTAISILIVIAAIFIYPDIFRNPVYIIATGDHGVANDITTSSEVWVLSVSVNNRAIDLSSLALSLGWEYSDHHGGSLLSMGNQPATLYLNLPPGIISIDFYQHAWSGVVKIGNTNEHHIVDLFMAGEGTSVYTHQVSNTNNRYVVLVFILSYLVCLAIYGLLSVVRRPLKKTQQIMTSAKAGMASEEKSVLFAPTKKFPSVPIIIIIKVATSIGLIVILFVIVFPAIQNYFSEPVRIAITATGLPGYSNPGGATEVWVTGILVDGLPFEISDVYAGEGWENRIGLQRFDWDTSVLVSYQNQPATVEVWIPPGIIEVTFVQHRWSGLAVIEALGEQVELDLYNTRNSSTQHYINASNTGLQTISFIVALATTLAVVCLLFKRQVLFITKIIKEFTRSIFDKYPNCLYYIASLLAPNILLLNLFNGNRVVGNVFFSHVIFVCMLLALLSLLLFHLLRKITNTTEGAVLLTTIFWFCFWLFEPISSTFTFTFIINSTMFLIVSLFVFFTFVYASNILL